MKELLNPETLPLLIITVCLGIHIAYYGVAAIVGKKFSIPKRCKFCVFLPPEGTVPKCDNYLASLIPWQKKDKPCITEGFMRIEQSYMELQTLMKIKKQNRTAIQAELAKEKLVSLADELGVDSPILAHIKERLETPCIDYFPNIYDDEQLDRLQIDIELERQILMSIIDDLERFPQFALSHTEKIDKLTLDCMHYIDSKYEELSSTDIAHAEK